MTDARVLVVEDDPDLRALLAVLLTQRGLAVTSCGDGNQAIALLRDAFDSADSAVSADSARPTAAGSGDATAPTTRGDFDVILTDLRMPGCDGLELCRWVRANRPDVPVVVLTSFGSLESAVGAIRAGAFDFVSKPVENELLDIAIDRAIAQHRLASEVRTLTLRVANSARFEELIGSSPPMRDLFRTLDAAAESDAAVLLLGESGSGKELVARALHARSRRRRGPFQAVNCAALPDTLLESELFGHVKGAFTDASRDRRGLVFEADGGTLFLDEIGDCSPAFQAKLLRVLEERKARPLGSDRELPFDVRLVTATHRDLEAAIEEGRFRQDLYYRICVLLVRVPPLRERGSDVLLLAKHFMDEIAKRTNKPVTGFTEATAARLLDHSWPGNARELRNAMEHAVALARTSEIGVDDLPERVRTATRERIVIGSQDPRELLPMDEIERRYVENVLRAVGGNKTAAARVLGFDRKTLYRKLERYGLDDGAKPDSAAN